MLGTHLGDGTAVPLRARPIGMQDLGDAANEALALFARIPRQQWVNHHGGDVGCSGSRRNILRHTANYALAAELATAELPSGPVVDVGGGVGALGLWLARKLGRSCWLVEPDDDTRQAATAAFPDLVTFGDLGELPAATGAVVVAMEVVEHIARAAQHDFVCSLRRAAAPSALVALSTPDETSYVGGSSGYRPHVGTLTAAQFSSLVVGAGLPAALWRLEGPAFRIPPHQRIVTPLLNRTWHATRHVAPGPVDAASRALASLRTAMTRSHLSAPLKSQQPVWAAPLHVGTGSGLFAASRTPSS